MRRHRIARIANLLLLVSAAGCSSAAGSSSTGPAPTSGGSASGAADGGAHATPPPAPASSNPACIISADCPAGQYCDLEECVQSCSTSTPCTGGLTCSPRGRCEPPGTPDQDPTPTGQSQGALTVTPTNVLLGASDSQLVITLRSSGTQAVRYRIALDGSHLSVATSSGSFTGSKTITIGVDPTKASGQNEVGTVRIYTTLGDAVVDAPIHSGVTGSYKGKMRYDGGPVALGDTQFSLDLLESSGSLKARVHSADSLLFPATASGDATGLGTFSASSGVDTTMVQVFDAKLGGASNPFGRPIGRAVRFQLKPNTIGGLDGTFQETIAGLFPSPITTTGHVTLSYVQTDGVPSFSVGAQPVMPTSPGNTAPLDAQQVLQFDDGECSTLGAPSLSINETAYFAPLQSAFSSQTSSTPGQPFFENIAQACQESLKVVSIPAWQKDALAQACGLPAVLACQLRSAVLSSSPQDGAWGPNVARLTSEMLQAPLLVAKNEVVAALKDSFTSGVSQEKAHYVTALGALTPYAAWASQPAMIEFLRELPAAAAQGSASTSIQTQDQPYPSIRALADLFYTMALVRGEQARVEAATASTAQASAVNAQQQALLTYLEAATVSEILKQWATVPPAVSAQFTGVLTPLDQGFSALLQGGNVFGVPDGFVPFVYRPSDVSKGASNFEQMLAIASNATTNENNIEMQFTAEGRAYDTAVAALQQELTNVQLQYDERIAADCGTDFNINQITSTSDPNWSQCGGPNNEGAVGQASLTVQLAGAALDSAQSRINGAKQKIQIDVNTLEQQEMIQGQTLTFIEQNGQQIGAVDLASGLADAAIQTIETASHADIWNGGAPLEEADGVALLGAFKAQLAQQRDQLQTAQNMQIQMGQNEMANLSAVANIQKEEIDLAQAVVDIVQQQLGAVQAALLESDKIAEAKQIWEDRSRQLAVIQQDPTHDPSYRLLRDSLAVQVIAARAAAQQQLYLATSALEYEINTSIPNAVGPAMNATNATNLAELQSCLLSVYNNARVAYGSPQDYITTVSVRQMLGITGPRKDPVTGQTLTEGEQFRQLLLKNENLDGHGGVGITFSTDLQSGNKLWASDVCNDRLASVQAQVVGNFQGDNEAQVNLSLAGGAVLRACDSDTLNTWSLGSTSSTQANAVAIIQAGVNSFGEAPANTSLFGQAVARANWTLLIPGGQVAPANADLNITQIDDVVLRFDHQALPRQTSPVAIDLSCLGTVGQ